MLIRFEENEFGELVKAYFGKTDVINDAKIITFEKGVPSLRDKEFLEHYKKYISVKVLETSNEINELNKEAKQQKDLLDKINKIVPMQFVEYKGGGYSGCFWEYNYCVWDKEGKWHDIYSSGYAGKKTEDEIIKFMIEEPKECSAFDISTAEGRRELTDSLANGHLQMVIKKLVEIVDLPFYRTCDKCGKEFLVGDLNPADYSCESGLVYSPDNLYCENCMSEITSFEEESNRNISE